MKKPVQTHTFLGCLGSLRRLEADRLSRNRLCFTRTRKFLLVGNVLPRVHKDLSGAGEPRDGRKRKVFSKKLSHIKCSTLQGFRVDTPLRFDIIVPGPCYVPSGITLTTSQRLRAASASTAPRT